MAKKKRTQQKAVPLIIEPHPQDYEGYPFITLIQYRNEHVLAIIDNADDKKIKAYVLDLCGPEDVDEEAIVTIASEWYSNSEVTYPLSIEFSKRGISNETVKILRTFNTDFVTRIIGPLPKFAMTTTQKVKRRRRKPVPDGVEVHKKILDL